MADKEDFLTLQQEIASVPAKQAVEPPMPPEQLVDEAEMAADLASRHAEALAPLGITADVIDKLAKSAGAMRYAQAEWSNQVFDSTEAQQQWREDSPLGYELRDDVLAALEFGAGGDAGLLRKISNIRKGSSNADMTQDLLDTAVVGRDHRDALVRAAYDESKLSECEVMADRLGRLNARSSHDRSEYRAAKLMRDKASVVLKELVDRVRKAGKYAFRKDPETASMFTSDYWRKQKNKRQTETAPMEAPVA